MVDRIESLFHTRPPSEYSSRIGSKGDDITQYLQFWKFFEYDRGMAFAVTFYGGCETCKAGANDDDTDARGLGSSIGHSHIELI